MGFLCGWSVGLEFPAGQLAESDYWREQFQTISEDVSVRNVLLHSAHWRFHDVELYKSTFYLLTYLLQWSISGVGGPLSGKGAESRSHRNRLEQ